MTGILKEPAPVQQVIDYVHAVPDVYDTHLGPHLFEPAAVELAQYVAEDGPTHVLEVACGSGIATEQLRRALGADATIVATDIDSTMLDRARTRRGYLPGVSWRIADAIALPFADASFDATVCQLGMMFFPARVDGVRQMTRVTRPGGRVTASVWDSVERNPFALIAQQVVDENCRAESPRILDVPFSDCDVDELARRFRDAGLIDLHIQILARDVPCNPSSLAKGLIQGTLGVSQIHRLAATSVADVTRELAAELRRRFANIALTMPVSHIVISGRRAR